MQVLSGLLVMTELKYIVMLLRSGNMSLLEVETRAEVLSGLSFPTLLLPFESKYFT